MSSFLIRDIELVIYDMLCIVLKFALKMGKMIIFSIISPHSRIPVCCESQIKSNSRAKFKFLIYFMKLKFPLQNSQRSKNSTLPQVLSQQIAPIKKFLHIMKCANRQINHG
jgi:uncharacterized membrane protein required for colicin V production